MSVHCLVFVGSPVRVFYPPSSAAARSRTAHNALFGVARTMSSDLPVPKSFGLTYDPPSITVVYALNEKLRACKSHSPPCDCAGHHPLRLILRRQAHDARA